MAGMAKQAKRAVKRVTMAWRHGLIDHSPPWLKKRFGPLGTYLDMLFIDHGIFRLIYLNKHQLAPGAFRSAQPAPHQFRSLKKAGIKTIVNLRGERICGSYAMERKCCEELGLNLVNYKVRSRAAPSLEEIHGARELFLNLQHPFLMHCKSGADRAGWMSVLYLHVHEDMPIKEAMRELSLGYGHIRQADTGVLDYFFECYLAHNEKHPMSFFEWVDTVYDPDEVKGTFKATGWANRIVNTILKRE